MDYDEDRGAKEREPRNKYTLTNMPKLTFREDAEKGQRRTSGVSKNLRGRTEGTEVNEEVSEGK